MSSKKIIIRKSADLLKQAKTVFGNVVVNAWFSNKQYDYLTVQEIAEKLGQDAKNFKAKKHTKGILDLDAATILLEFTGGKTVEFSSSEWTTLSQVDMSLTEERSPLP